MDMLDIQCFWKSAQANPDRVALIDRDESQVTAGELLSRANQIVHGLRGRGLVTGDTVALSLPNGAKFFEVLIAVMQAGWNFAPLNPHLTSDEIAYILADSGAKAFFGASDRAGICTQAVKASGMPLDQCFSLGEVPGFTSIEELCEDQPSTLLNDRVAGQYLQYTSGTTGRPKGVRREILPKMDPEFLTGMHAQHLAQFDILPGGNGVYLCGSPLYHLASLSHTWFSMNFDHLVVLMEHWDSEEALRLIEKYHVTSSHMVPTQFHRLLQLPEEVRKRYDVSSLNNIIHAAAPCPVELKKRMFEWWGPVIYEYYGASEGGGTLVKPKDWLAHPGTVGRPWAGGAEVRIYDDDGKECPAEETGTVYMKLLHAFEYGGDADKTRKSRIDDFFTVGDIGYLDKEGYLFLCDRKIDMIIAGGVNVYPAEAESLLTLHPKVGDVAVFGIPHPDWGEEVKAVVEPAKGIEANEELAAELIEYCLSKLAKYKCPRSIDFTNDMPRDPNGKLYKRRLRDPYWVDHQRQI